MRKDEQGFSLLELLIAIAIMGIVMAMSMQLLQSLIGGQRQQAAIVAGQFESTLGMEMMRSDVSNAGFGLADEFKSAPGTYSEATSNPSQQFNDAPNVPKALAHSNNVGSFTDYIANSDYLVIRSPAVGINSAAGKWTNITGTTVHIWNDVNLDMVNGRDYMVVIKPRSTLGGRAQLIVSAGAYAPQYVTSALDVAFQPSTSTGERYLAFGIDDTNIPVRPFNRADYYVKKPSTANPNCASGTGSLVKFALPQSAAVDVTANELPLIECVANMQVVFRLDTNLDGVPEDPPVNDISGLDALAIKEQVKEVRVYLLTHEGIMDRRFKYGGANPITVGPTAALGTSVNLTAFGTDWDHYRWKVHTLVIKPKSFY
ncbi:MAG: prepilin-type N-terminal cleavage/methylation domain-containing protein [Syntrophorhabdaceae bacterium]|nr:prepilin-type N-terminal cleavage/methylation domain-containing protein [Syntrophorhabdaceae bacterium]